MVMLGTKAVESYLDSEIPSQPQIKEGQLSRRHPCLGV